MDSVLLIDLVDGERHEVRPPYPDSPPPPVMRRIMQEGPELILRQPADMEGEGTEFVRFGDASRLSASLMYVALRRDGQPIGVLSLQSYTPNAYTQDDLRTLQALADHCAGALDRIRAETALREAHDKLEQRVQERTAELREANAALATNEARLEFALDASSAGTWSWDAASNQSLWDERYHELYGFEPHDPKSFDAWIARVHPEDRERLVAAIRSLVETGGGAIWNEEFRALHPVKGERWMAGLGRVERGPSGRAVRVAGINLDITERKRAEEAQRSQLAQIEAIYQSAPVGLCVLDANLRYLRINERLAAMNGLPVAEHLGRTVREAVPHLAEGTEALWRQAFDTGQPVLNLELTGTTDAQPGALRTWVTSWVPLKELNGRVSGVSVVVEEVTERKRMDQALRESEAKYRRLHESMTDAFVQVGMDGRITECNRAYQALLGYTADELSRLAYTDLTPERWHGYEAQIVSEQILQHGHSAVYEKEYRRKDGTVFPVELRTFLLDDEKGEPIGMWAIVRDITERKQAEAALREAHETLERRVLERTAELQAANGALAESEERYRSLVNNLNVGIYRNRPGFGGGFVHANPALARMHGYDSVEEFQKVKVADLYQNRKDRDKFLTDLRREGTLLNYELRLRKKDGSRIYGSVNATAHLDADGKMDWIDGVLEDITERKHAQEALRSSEERYRALSESSPDAIFILDRDIRVQYVNVTAAALWRRAPEDLIGRSQAELFPPETAQYHSKVIRSVFATGAPVQRDEPLAFPVGDQWIEIRLSPLYDAQGKISSVMGICRDITERKRAEQQLAEALDLNQKMIAAASVGIAAYKATGECVFANEALAQTLGGKVAAVRQSNFRRLKAWKESGLLELANKALKRGQARSGEFSAITRFGKPVWLDCHVARFVSNGQPHLLLMALDISERKRAEAALKQAERLQRSILDTIPDPAWLKDAQGRFLACNQAMTVFYGRPAEAFIGKTVSECNPREAARMIKEDHEVMTTRRSGVFEGKNIDFQGRLRWFESIKSPLLDERGEEVTGTVGIAREITERKWSESLLRAQRDLGVSLSLYERFASRPPAVPGDCDTDRGA